MQHEPGNSTAERLIATDSDNNNCTTFRKYFFLTLAVIFPVAGVSWLAYCVANLLSAGEPCSLSYVPESCAGGKGGSNIVY